MSKKFSIVTILICVAALVMAGCGTFGGGLPSLKSSIVLKTTSLPGGKTIKVMAPYTSVNYYGFVKPGQAADAVIGGKKMYFLYLWVPAIMAEMGVRMISPTGEIGEPGDDDIVSDQFKKAKDAEKKMPTWFDCWVNIERMKAVMPNQIVKAAKGKPVQKLGSNDDGDNTYVEKRHSRYNSLKRVTLPRPPKSFNDLKNLDTKKLLVRGLYRIAFTTYKRGEVKGSFVATVGVLFPPGIPGLSPIISNDAVKLQALAVKAEAELKKKMSGK